ncbi:MAG: caspase family protein, partial [Thermoanaerobaculia bacterium]|nr:caspase family protein [Thermoanaerobaculia bacterium]
MLSSILHNRHALLIGINRYPFLPREKQLLGAVNDAELMRRVLIDDFEFPPASISLLRDAEATRGGILAAFESLLERVGGSDIVVVHYSGHGSQIRSCSSHEPDGLAETIVPHDGHRDPNREPCDIVDDEVFTYLARLAEQTPFVTLVLDCCHSGHAYRNGVGSRHVPPDLRPAPQLPAVPTPGRLGSIFRDRCVVLAACRDDEEAFERRRGGGEVAHGHWTFALLRTLHEARPGATVRDVFERACARVLAEGSRQRPQIEGARDRTIFGVEPRPPARFVAVGAFCDGRPTLAAGAAQGLAEGSVWAVYPQGTKRPGEVAELARVRVIEVGALSSIAEVLEPVGVVFEAGARAFEHEPAYGDRRLTVAAGDGGVSRGLLDRIEKSPVLRLAAVGETPDVVALAGSLELVDRHGHLVARPASTRAEPSLDATLARLERR